MNWNLGSIRRSLFTFRIVEGFMYREKVRVSAVGFVPDPVLCRSMQSQEYTITHGITVFGGCTTDLNQLY
jgi:hypothetical protein